MEPGHLLTALLLTPFLGAASLLVLPKSSDRLPWIVTMLTTSVALVLLGLLTPVADSARVFVPWVPAFGLNFSLWLDGPALFYAWLVTGMGFLIFLYSGSYMDPKDSPWRFFGTMMLFMGSMLGVVLSRNALLMFIFWELTSVTSFILIGHWHEKASARRGALQALIVTGMGGLCLMGGIAGWYFMLGGPAGAGADALEWDVLWARKGELLGGPFAVVFMLLVLAGGFTKSAQFPFHFWLPGAMEAPTPVSAYLHAATMVKAGIYLFGRIYPIYESEPLWLLLVGGAGVLTMCIGGYMALQSNDLKQLLAHSTVSQLGLLTAYYGFGFDRVGSGSKLPLDLMLVASHALFKGSLFMLCGVIDHGAHTREWKRLGGLFKMMPVTAVLTIIGCASMAGLPLTFGFVAKELFLKAALKLDAEIAWLNWALPAVAVAASFFTVAYCCRMAISPFFGKPRDNSIHAHEGGFWLLFSPGLLAVACLVGGVYTAALELPLAAMTNAAFYGTSSGFHWAMFHGVDKLLYIGGALFAGGFVLFLMGGKVEALQNALGSPAPFRSTYRKVFDDWVPTFAERLTAMVQSPSLSRNVLLAFTVLALLVAAAWSQYPAALAPFVDEAPAPLHAVLILGFLFVSVVVAVSHPLPLVRLLALAPVGLLVAIMFLAYKAPDLALTQILVEVVTLIVMLLLLFRLPQRYQKQPGRLEAGSSAVVALAGGAVLALVTLVGSGSQYRSLPLFPEWPSTADYYLQNSKYSAVGADGGLEGYPGAELARGGGGTNVVNVILVDFRGFDTFGEITVLAIAGLGVLSLLGFRRTVDQERHKLRRERRRKEVHDLIAFQQGGQREPILRKAMWQGTSLILREAARLIPALILMYGIVLFMAGHNNPGGGFIAGLMVSVALAVLFVTFRRSEIVELHRYDFARLLPVGLLFAVGTGLVALAFAVPFLTSSYAYVAVPLFGKVEIASALGFDLGVFLVVVGVTTLILQKFGGE